MGEITVMKKCCGLCPFSRKNTLYVNIERAEDFAYHASNPYNDFVCHKTGVVLDDTNSEDDGSIVRGEKSLTCAGFHVLQHITNGKEKLVEINIDYEDHFSEPYEMIEHHEEEWYKNNKEL